MANSNEIQIKITADNKDAISAFRQLVEAARAASAQTRSAGEGAGQGFSDSAREIQGDANSVIGVLNKIANTLGALARAFGVVSAENAAAMQESATAANSSASATERANEKIVNSNKKATESRRKLNEESVKSSGSSGKYEPGVVSFSSAILSGEGFLGTLGKIGLAAQGLKAIFETLKGAIETAFGPGIELNRTLETAKLGVAGIITSMETNNGEDIKLNDALAVSGKAIDELQQNAVKIGLPMKDMITAFQTIVGPALEAKMSMKEMVDFTTIGTKAVKTVMGPQANEMQITQELRSMVSGNIDQNSQLAKAMGITNEGVEEAKKAAGGLFKYLDDHLAGFKETAEVYPETFNGVLEKFKNSLAQAQGGAVKPFMDEFKHGLTDVGDLLFDINEQTGKVEFNPLLVSVVDDLNSGLKEMKRYCQDVGVSLEWTNTTLPVLQDLYSTTKNLSAAFLDLLRVGNASYSLFDKYFDQAVRDLAHDMKELSLETREFWDWLAQKVGAKQSAASQGVADFKRSEDTNTQPSIGNPNINMTPKFQTQDKDHFAEEKRTMQTAFSNIDAELQGKLTDLQTKLENLNSEKEKYSPQEFEQQKLALEVAIRQAPVLAIQQKMGVVNSTDFKHESERTEETAKLNNELAKANKALSSFSSQVSDVANLIDKTGNFNNNGNYADRQIFNEAGQYKDMVIKAALQEGVNPLLFAALTKAESSFNPKAESSVGAMGMTQLMPDTAAGLGVNNPWDPWENLVGGAKYLRQQLEMFNGDVNKAIAAYNAGPQAVKDYNGIPPYRETQNYVATIKGYMNYEDVGNGMIQKGSVGTPTNGLAYRVKQLMGDFGSKAGKELRDELIALYKELDGVEKEVAGLKGNDSAQLKSDIRDKYAELWDKFSKTFTGTTLAESQKKIEEAIAIQENNVDISQATKEIERILIKTTEEENRYLLLIKLGLEGVGSAFDKQHKVLNDAIAPMFDKLNKDMEEAKRTGNIDGQNKIKQLLKSLNDTLFSQVQARIDAVGTWAQDRTNSVNSKPYWTSGMKQERTEEIDRVKAADIAKIYKDYADKLQTKNSMERSLAEGEGRNPDMWANQLRGLQAYNEELAKLPDLLTRAENAGRQGLENGLNTFFETGWQKCHKLIDAVEDLAISILTEMNKVFSQQLTRNIMNSLFGQSSDNSMFTFNYSPLKRANGGSLLAAFADGGQMSNGIVKGPGTSTSDSIMAYIGNLKKFVRLSDGEYVMKGAAVKKYGTDLMDRINNGLIPPGFADIKEKYATGGSLSGRQIVGADRIANSLTLDPVIQTYLTVANLEDPDKFKRFIESRQGQEVIVNAMGKNGEIINRLLSKKH